MRKPIIYVISGKMCCHSWNLWKSLVFFSEIHFNPQQAIDFLLESHMRTAQHYINLSPFSRPYGKRAK